ncbi:MAG: hypothetical protein WCO09_00785 [bacterium]
MNYKQARIQGRLSQGKSLGQDSSIRPSKHNQNNNEDANDDRYNIYTKNRDSGEDRKDKKVSKTTFLIMLFVALILDIIGLVPILGWFISSLILIIIYIKLGVKFHLKNILKFGACDTLKFIPFLSLFPSFFLSVFLNLGPMVDGIEKMIAKAVEMLTDVVAGGDEIAGKLAGQVVSKSMRGRK